MISENLYWHLMEQYEAHQQYFAREWEKYVKNYPNDNNSEKFDAAWDHYCRVYKLGRYGN